MEITRGIDQKATAIATQDGAGVAISRAIGQGQIGMIDPFLLLDEIRSDNADDYIAGFPPHPHRGFDTVTYMVDGKMRHKDSNNNEGVISSGGVQWMRAGRGVIHSEIPEQENGPLWGYQLWINLPAKHKMDPSDYRDIHASEIPIIDLENNGEMRVISGTPTTGVTGPLVNPYVDLIFLDITLEPNSSFSQAIPNSHAAFAYLSNGSFSVKNELVNKQTTIIFDEGNQVAIQTHEQTARLLLIAGKPLDEPVARYGPFVMNTRDEINQAVADYQNGALVSQ